MENGLSHIYQSEATKARTALSNYLAFLNQVDINNISEAESHHLNYWLREYSSNVQIQLGCEVVQALSIPLFAVEAKKQVALGCAIDSLLLIAKHGTAADVESVASRLGNLVNEIDDMGILAVGEIEAREAA